MAHLSFTLFGDSDGQNEREVGTEVNHLYNFYGIRQADTPWRTSIVDDTVAEGSDEVVGLKCCS